MPCFDDEILVAAPPEEVWKYLYDPMRFPDWFAGVASVADVHQDADGVGWTQFPDGYPDFPMPQRLAADRRDGQVVISCLVSDIRMEWVLAATSGDDTQLRVHVELPEKEARRLADERTMVRASLERLARLATAAPRRPG
jgi:uncharacterized protein YndB with AHSA1/START domain